MVIQGVPKKPAPRTFLATKILNTCNKYDVKGFNCLTKSIHNAKTSNFSCLCNNIDGNASNFDQFASEILGQLKIVSPLLHSLKLILTSFIKTSTNYLIMLLNIMKNFLENTKVSEYMYIINSYIIA